MKYKVKFTFDGTNGGFEKIIDSIYDVADYLMAIQEQQRDINTLARIRELELTGLIVTRLEDKDDD
jgi:hypothetical protein